MFVNIILMAFSPPPPCGFVQLGVTVAVALTVKSLNDETVMWSDFEMRDSSQELHLPHPLQVVFDGSTDYDWFVCDRLQETVIDFSIFYLKIIYSCNHREVFPWAVSPWKTKIIFPALWQDKLPVMSAVAEGYTFILKYVNNPSD